ncbi:MAG: N-acetyltransferase [Alphaproteobacteria bacterium]|nr:MAG: N-acetyltransferase [Alphaproteobacteria bacterium]
MPDMIGKFVNNLKTLGFGPTLLYALSRVARASRGLMDVRSYRLMAQPVADAPRLSERRRTRFTARPLVPDDDALSRLPLDRETLARRFAAGAQCLGLFSGDALVAALWYQFGDYDEDEVRCRFRPADPERAAWDFDVYVQPEWRAGFAFAALWDAADATLRAAGRRYSLSRISAFNLASLHSHRRLGAQEVGRASFLRLGSLQICVSSLSPRLHFSWREAGGPLILIPVPAPKETQTAGFETGAT